MLLNYKKSVSSVKDNQLQTASTSLLSVISEIQISEDSVSIQYSNVNNTYIRRIFKTILFNACIIDLNSLKLSSFKIRSQKNSLNIKKKDNCIKITQKDFLLRIKQKSNNQDC